MRTRKNLKSTVSLVCAVMATGGLVHQTSAQTTTTFQPGVTPDVSYDIDAVYIRQGQSNQNGDTDLEVLVGWSGGPFRGLLEFDLSEIPSTDLVDSVSLFLKTRDNAGGSGTGVQYHLYEYGFDIDEGAATWAAPAVSDADPTDGGTLGTLLASVTFDSSNQGEEVTFLDSAAFRTAIENALAGDGFVRFLIKENNETGTAFARFADENWPDTSFRPKLTVQHTASNAPPEIVSSSPADDSTGAYVGTDLVATFNKDIALTGAGSISVTEIGVGADGSSDFTIDLTSLPDPDAAVSVSDKDLIIDPTANLEAGMEYEVTIDGSALEDTITPTPNAYAGTSSGEWTFETVAEDLTAPVIVPPTSPPDEDTDVAPNVNLVAAFDEDLVLGSGTITLVDVTDGSGTQVISVPGPAVSVDGTVLTINPPADLEGASVYAVQLGAGVVRNFNDVGNGAITDTTTWNFSVTSDTVFVSTANTSGDDTWNQGGNWDIGAAPSGSLTATISTGLTATSDEVPDTYSGGLTFEANSELDLRNGAGSNALGSGPITMEDGSILRLRVGSLTISNDISFAGSVDITNSSNTTDNKTRTLDGTLSGTGQLTYSMRRGNTLYIDGTNTSWSGGFVGNCSDIITSNLPNGIEPGVNGAFGSGDVTLNDGVRLVLNGGLGDAIDDAAALNLNGDRARDGHKLVLGSDETVGLLNRKGFPYPAGTYGATGSGATYEYSWISGSGILTVASDNGDATGPVGTIVNSQDDATDVLVSEIYTIDFDEPIVRGSGNILIKNLTDATTTTIPASDTLQAKIVDETRLIIDPIVNLLPGKDYAIQIEATAFEDLFGNAYAGILDDTTLNFSTVGSKIAFTEDFEPPLNPDVVGYEQGTRPALWDGHSGTFGATRHGLVDKFNGVDEFDNPIPTGDWDDDGVTANTQAYRLNYTSSPGITTEVGEIGIFTLGTTYTVEFDVQQLGTNAADIGYDGRLYAFNDGGNRSATNTGFGGDLLVSTVGEVPADGDFHTVVMSVTGDPSTDAGSVTKDVGVMFKDRWSGSGGFEAGIHDNVVVTLSAETIAPTLVSIVDDVSGGPVTAGDTVVYTVTFDDWMDASTIGTDDFENGSTAGITVVGVSATSDPAVYEVTVNTASAGDLTLQIKAGAVINDAAHNALDTGGAIVDDTTITVDPGAGGTPYADWAATNSVTGGFDDDDDLDGTPNGFEWYYFDTDPLVAGGNGSPLTEATKTGANTFEFTHNRPLERNDVTETYLWSTDLVTWYEADGTDTDGTNTLDIVFGAPVPGPTANLETVTVEATISGTSPAKLFVRQELTYP